MLVLLTYEICLCYLFGNYRASTMLAFLCLKLNILKIYPKFKLFFFVKINRYDYIIR